MTKSIIVKVLIFAAGAGTGYFVGWKLTKDKYEVLVEDEIESVREMFRNKYCQEPTVVGTAQNGMTDEEYEDRNEEQKTTVPEVNDHFAKSSIERAGKKTTYERAKVAYHDMAKEELMRSAMENGIEDEDDDEGDDTDEPYLDAAGHGEGDYESAYTTKDMTNVVRRCPYVIDDRQFSEEFPHHDKVSLYFYTEDEVLCDENEEPMDDIEGTVGYGVFKILEEEGMAWARNEKLAIDYEICTVPGSYAKLVHGIELPTKEDPIKTNLSPRERYERTKRSENGER